MLNFSKLPALLRVISVAAICCFLSLPLRAQTFEFNTTPTALNFGDFAITDNSVQQTITINVDDTGCLGENHTPGITLNEPTSCGEYLLSGLDPNMAFGVNITFDDLTKVSTAKEFIIDDFTTSNPVTNGSGEATLYVGATLFTMTTGGVYPDGAYNGTMSIVIMY